MPESSKLRRRGHPSVIAARRELIEHGYRDCHSAAPVRKWARHGKADLAIVEETRPRSSVFHIVGYPVDPYAVSVKIFKTS